LLNLTTRDGYWNQQANSTEQWVSYTKLFSTSVISKHTHIPFQHSTATYQVTLGYPVVPMIFFLNLS